MKIEELAPYGELSQWQVRKMWELFTVDEDSRYSKPVGLFSSRDMALVYAQTRPDPRFHGTEEVFALTDGHDAFVLREKESIKVFSDQETINSVRTRALAKLSDSERKALGLS